MRNEWKRFSLCDCARDSFSDKKWNGIATHAITHTHMCAPFAHWLSIDYVWYLKIIASEHHVRGGLHESDSEKSGITLSRSLPFLSPLFLSLFLSLCMCVCVIESNARAIAIYSSLSFGSDGNQSIGSSSQPVMRCEKRSVWRQQFSNRKDNNPRNETERKKKTDSIQALAVDKAHVHPAHKTEDVNQTAVI